MNKILYIAEGETEERFIKFLIQNNFIKPGKFKKFNLMQNKLALNNNILSKKVDKIYCILDTDVMSIENISKLICNLKILKSICSGDIMNLIQYKNFEDELKFLLDCTDLGQFLNIPYNSNKDLKTFLTQKISYKSYITKENIFRYCARSNSFKEELSKYPQNVSGICITTIEKCMP